MFGRFLMFLLIWCAASFSAPGFEPLGPLPQPPSYYKPMVEGPDGKLYGIAGTLFRVSRDGTGYEALDHPADLTPEVFVFGKDGNIYGVKRNILVRISLSGHAEVLHAFQLQEDYSGPGHMIVAEDGSIYGSIDEIGEVFRGFLYRLQMDGTVTQFDSFTLESFSSPQCLIIGHDGAVWASGSGGEQRHAILRLGSDGVYSYPAADQQFGFLYRIFAHPDGNYYVFASQYPDTVVLHRLAPDGTVTKVAEQRVYFLQRGIILGRDGNFYIPQDTGIIRITPAGERTGIGYETPLEYGFPGGPMQLTLAHDGFFYTALRHHHDPSKPTLLARMKVGEQGVVDLPILPPLANADFARIPRPGESVTISVLVNDLDPNGEPIAITGIGSPGAGTAVLDPSGQKIIYTAPVGGPILEDEFTYTITDGVGGTAIGHVALRPNLSGLYANLISSTDPELDGYLQLTLTDLGSFTGKLCLGGMTWPARGAFDLDNTTMAFLSGSQAPQLMLSLQFRSGDLRIQATVIDGSAVRAVELSRPNATVGRAAAGTYTWMMPPNGEWRSEPAMLDHPLGWGKVRNPLFGVVGYGYGAMTVLPSGLVRVSGRMPNGRVITTSVPIDASGSLRLFATFNRPPQAYADSRGWVGGGVAFRDRAGNSDADGTLQWYFPGAIPKKGYQPPLRQTSVDFLASRYVRRGSLAQALNATTLRFEAQAGGLPKAAVTSLVSAGGQITSSSPVSIGGTFTSISGLVSGSFRPSGWTHGAVFRGATFQKQGIVVGQFPAFRPPGTGLIRIRPNP